MAVNVIQMVRQGRLKSIRVTLAANVPMRVNLPVGSFGFSLRPQAETRFAVGEDPEASAVDNGLSPRPYSIFKIGAVAEANQWETRVLSEPGDAVYISLLSAANTTCDIEVF